MSDKIFIPFRSVTARWFGVALVLCCALFAAGCSGSSAAAPERVNVHGILLGIEGNGPLGMRVPLVGYTVRYGSDIGLSSMTDAKGDFSIPVPVDSLSAHVVLTISDTKGNYFASQTVNASAGEGNLGTVAVQACQTCL